MKDGYLIKLLKLHKDIAIELKSQVVDLAEKMKEAYGADVESLTPEEANKRLGYHRYNKGTYTVYALKEE